MGRFLQLFLTLAAIFLLAAQPCGAADADERLEAFLDETAALYGPTEADVVQKLGPPRHRQAVPFSNPYDATPYEIITLTYDGLVVSLYSMEEGQRQFFHQIRVTSGPTCFARRICLGTPRERLAVALGQPEDLPVQYERAGAGHWPGYATARAALG